MYFVVKNTHYCTGAFEKVKSKRAYECHILQGLLSLERLVSATKTTVECLMKAALFSKFF